LHGRAHLLEQCQAGSDAEAMFGAEISDRGAVDEIHHKVGKAIFGGAAVHNARDVGMVEAGEDLTLLAEAIEEAAGRKVGTDYFDGTDALKNLVGADSL